MKRLMKWSGVALLVALLVLAGVAVGLKYWVGSEDFRGRVAQQVSSALGVPVMLGRITVDVWPLPAVALDQVQIRSRPPLVLERVEARPEWAPLLQGRLAIATLLVRGAVVPEQAVTAVAAAFQKRQRPAKDGGAPRGVGNTMDLLPRRVVLEQVTWINAKGESTTIDARTRLDDEGVASAALEVRKGRFEGAKATLERMPGHWALRAAIASGTITGKMQLRRPDKGVPVLQGEFDTANVEVGALTAPARTLTGRLDAHTSLRAALRESQALADTLHPQTRFTVRNAVVHGLDLAQAVKTVGLSRGGETHLDTLAGNVTTQGRLVQLNNLVATSGLLSANGNVAMAANRNLSGRITVNLAAKAAGGAIGVPLEVAGTLDSPSVNLSRGALVGAAIGTLMAPGIGTGAGAKLGDTLGEGLRGLFGK
jgi:uncharacterized protein involved in outer membrane biogenesis